MQEEMEMALMPARPNGAFQPYLNYFNQLHRYSIWKAQRHLQIND